MAANASLAQSEEPYAFLDDTCVTTSPDRTAQAFRSLQAALKTHANIDLHLGKTKAWNAAGEEPSGLREIASGGPDDPPTWVGDATLPPEQQGLMLLGTPLGSAPYVQATLPSKSLPAGMTQQSRGAWPICWPKTRPTCYTHLRCGGRTCRWQWAGWASALRSMAGTRPTGHPGPTRCPRCRLATRMRWRT